ncbi:MAG: O-antigen ligase family protein [Acidimicrobiales bacterium]
MRKLSFAALLAFAFSIPLEDSLQFGVGRVSRVFGILALVTWVLTVAYDGRVRRSTAGLSCAALFVGWSLLSYFWSTVPTATFSKVFTLVQMLLVVWIVWDQTETQKDLTALMRAFVFGSFAASAMTFLAAATGKATEGSRFASNNAGPNNTGALLAVAVAMACYLIRQDPTYRFKVLYRVFLPIAMVALVLTASRTAVLSLAAGLAIIVVDFSRLTPKRVAGLAAVGVVALGLAALYVPTKSVDRLATTQSEISSGTLNGRTLYWHLSYKIFADNPVGGIGSGSFPEANLLLGDRGIVAHNAFLSILAELGAVGEGLFLATIGLAAWGLVDQPHDSRRAWLAMGVTWFIGASALTWEVRKITWFVLAVALVQARVTWAERVASHDEADEADAASVGSGP